ncbi:ion channel [Escherichia coli]
MNELFYYSFISLTVGYGDIVAVSWPAVNATLVILTGYIYSLVFIARIVSGFSVSDKIIRLNCHFDVLYLPATCISRS